jgi:hypothetical protein
MHFSFFKKTVLLLCLIGLYNSGLRAQKVEDLKITGNYQHTAIPDILRDISRKYPVQFVYKSEWFAGDTVNVRLNETPFSEMIYLTLKDKSMIYKTIQNRIVVLLPKDAVTKEMGMLNDGSGLLGDVSTFIIGDANETGKYKTVEIKGIVSDGKDDNPIIGATIQFENTTYGAITGAKGDYSIVVKPGIYKMVVSNLGYEKTEYRLKVISNGSLDVNLFEKSLNIDEVIINSQKPDKNVRSVQMSVVEMDSRGIKQLPSLNGEKDILKSMTMMPGVKSVGEFGSGINVRGGGEDQNLYIVENAPLYNTAHVFGFLSALNPDMISNVTLYKGHIPAGYGERVSSVMDIQLRDNKIKDIHAKGGLGLYNSRLMVEGAITDKLTFKVGGRSSYSDWLLNKMPDYNLKNSSASFYDVNALLTYNCKDDKITVFGYRSYDKFNYAKTFEYQYSNNLASLNWTRIINSRWSSNLIAAYSNYSVVNDDIAEKYYKSRKTSEVSYTGLKYNVKYTGITNHQFDAGIQAVSHNIQPGKSRKLDTLSLINEKTLLGEQGYEGAAYINDNYEINSIFTLNLGLRFSGYAFVGPYTKYNYNTSQSRSIVSKTDSVVYGSGSIVKTYYGLEPRASLKIQVNDFSSVKLSYNRNIQYLSLLSYSSVSTPNDVWKLADPFIKPIICSQFAAGYFRNFKDNTYETSIELYYKELKNITDYKNGAVLSLNKHIETELVDAKGLNYGAELMLKKNKGVVDGWVSYTYSRSLKKTSGLFDVEQINRNEYYPSNVDKPHELTVMATYHMNRRWRFSANFSYATGRAVTLPEYQTSSGVLIYSDRNEYRLPDYHRLDLSINVDESLRIKKKWKGSWNFSLLNVYGRKNAYSVFYKKETPSIGNDFKTYSLYKLYIIGRPLPTITYNFIF